MLSRILPMLSLLPILMPSLAAFPEDWELRYVLKMSTPQDRPRWVAKPVPATADERAHLAVEETGPAAGGLLIGRRVRVPENLAASELAATFQTFCPMANRSGGVELGVMLPEVWDRLGRSAEAAVPPPGAGEWLAVQTIHPNREDVLEWKRSALRGAFFTPLEERRGKDVVVAVLWSTWHPGSEEWFRLAELHFGEAQPWIAAAAWPRSARTGEPLALRIEAWAPPPCVLEFGWRPVGGADWQWQPLAAAGNQFEARLAGEATRQPFEIKARLTGTDGTVLETSVHAVKLRQAPAKPGVFYSSEMLAAMRGRMAAEEWARRIAEGIRANAEAWRERRDEPPFGAGGWSHDYVCPEDGARLSWREDHPRDHLCRRCGKEWQGEKLDGNWRNNMHGRFVRAARDSALAAHLYGEPAYAETSRHILGWYARHYREFPEGRGPAGRGRVMSQSLSECSFLLAFMEAADLAFPFLSAEEQRAVETGVIEPGVRQISQFRFGIHNIQCWHNACMAAAGYFLGDEEWVERGNEGELGFHQQLAKGVLSDGLWYERSLGYHGFTLSALYWHCEAARLNGNPLHEAENLRLMCIAPLRLSFPNLVAPSLNDQGYSRGRIGTFGLELAVAWYNDETAASALRQLYALGAERNGLHLLKYGNDLPPGGDYVSPGSVDMPGAGLAILREGGGDGALCAMLEYGEHGGGHGHPDKLQLILYGLGQPLGPDLGTTGYGIPMHSQWYKTTPGHNTVTVGLANQRPTTGRLLAFHSDERASACAAESTKAYADWTLRRHLLLTDGFLVDVFSVEGEAPDTVDWFLRAPGQAGTSLALATDDSPAENRTYGYLKEKRSATTAESWTCQWETDKGTLLLTVAGEADTAATLAKAPGPAGEAPWDTLRIRRRTAATRFVAVYQFLAPGQTAQSVQFGPDAVRVGTSSIRLPIAGQPLPVLE